MAEKLTAAEQAAIDEKNALIAAVENADNINELKVAIRNALDYVTRT